MPLKPEIIVTSDSTELARIGARILVETAGECVDRKGRFTVALPGGSTPRHMNRMLAQEPLRSSMAWDKTHLFWVDERCVPISDAASNYGLAHEDFLGRVPIPVDHIHPMPGEVVPEEGARIYERELEAHFRPSKGEYPVFDLVFLGIGMDGHTASLFPAADSSVLSGKWVVAVKGGIPDVYRLTLTYDVLNRAKKICFLVSGKNKAQIVKTIFEDKDARLPAQGIRALHGELQWLMDKDASSLLPEGIIHGAS